MLKIDFDKVVFYDHNNPNDISNISISLQELINTPIKDIILGVGYYDGEASLTVDSIVLENDIELEVGSNIYLDAPVLWSNNKKSEIGGILSKLEETLSSGLRKREEILSEQDMAKG